MAYKRESKSLRSVFSQDKKEGASHKIGKILSDYKSSGKIGASRPKTISSAKKQAVAIAFSMARRGKF